MAGHPGLRQEQSVTDKDTNIDVKQKQIQDLQAKATPPMPTGRKLGYRERRTIVAHARNRSSSPFSHPTPQP